MRCNIGTTDKPSSFITIKQTLDCDIDPFQVGERKGGSEKQLKRDPIDRLDLQFAAKSIEPFVARDPGGHTGCHERRAMCLDMTIDLHSIGGRRQHKREQLHEIALSNVQLGEFPIQHYGAGSKADIALVEVVVDKCRGQPVLSRVPLR